MNEKKRSQLLRKTWGGRGRSSRSTQVVVQFLFLSRSGMVSNYFLVSVTLCARNRAGDSAEPRTGPPVELEIPRSFPLDLHADVWAGARGGTPLVIGVSRGSGLAKSSCSRQSVLGLATS